MALVKEFYPFKSHYLTVKGLRLHYLDEGQGDPVVMLHGNPTWSYYYRDLISELRGDHRTIVPDHMGCGLSDKPDDSHYSYTLQRRVDDLETLLDHLEIKKDITLIVHDWGGMIGMAYAVRHPERIKRIVAMNTAAFHLPKSKPFPWPLAFCRNPVGAFLVRGLNLFSWSASHIGCKRHPMSRAMRKAYRAPYDSWANRIAVLRFVQDIPLRPGDPSYSLVSEVENNLERLRKIPLLILWGEKDFVFDQHFLKEWRQRFPEAEVKTFPEAGHYVLEDAREDVLPAIRDFLKRHPIPLLLNPTLVRQAHHGISLKGEGEPRKQKEGDSFVNIASHLTTMAKSQPDKMAILFPEKTDGKGEVKYSQYTFRQLDEASDEIAQGLNKIGIRRGMRVVLMVKPSLEFFALTFALFKAGVVPVMIDPGMGMKSLKECIAQAQPEAFIGIPKAHIARILFGWGRDTLRILVTVGRRYFWGGVTLREIRKAGTSQQPFEIAPTSREETAAILFTSGSTGTPKGAVYTHGIFSTQVEFLRKIYNIEPGEIDLPTFPLFALFDPALGMTAIIPDMDATRPAQVDPKNIIGPIRKFGVTHLFGSPALIRQVGTYGEAKGVKLPSLKRVISAGAPVPASVLEKFSTMLSPGVEIFTPYGATEALPVCSVGSDLILKETRSKTDRGAGVCIGRPVEELRVEVIKISDAPIPVWSEALKVSVGEVGEIVVKGPIVTKEYYQLPEQTNLSKIQDPTSKSFYHRMGDLGYFDERGRLWFCGRKSHRVSTPTESLFTIPCEAVFNTHPQVYRSALVGVGSNGSIRPVLCVELEKGVSSQEFERIKGELLTLGATQAHTRGIQTILFHPAFPVDIRHNAKIFREKLALWASKQIS